MAESKLKICGITDYNTLKFCNENGVDFIGLVFTASKRRISLPDATFLLSRLDCRHSKIVGVFNGESEELIRSIADACNLDYIQLHGSNSYSPSLFSDFNVIKALPYNTNLEANSQSIKLSKYILIDSCTPGSGLTFDWHEIMLDISNSNLIIAGGICSTNIIEAIKTFNPQVIDISSGVETNGTKDIAKIEIILKLLGGTHEL